MAIDNQNDKPLPGEGSEKRRSSDLLPRYFRTTANVNFLQATLDQLIQPGVAEKLTSYYGRTTAKAFAPGDNYVPDVSKQRTDYQFEPAIVQKDELGTVNFYKDYNDITNQIGVFGGNTINHSATYAQDYHPWNPHIDWDKFVNFREYYWLPTGPQTVEVLGQSQSVTSTYSVGLTTAGEDTAFLFTPDGLTANPNLVLYRGQTYRFEIDTPGHPMAFAISRSFTPGNSVITATREGVRGEGLFDATLYGEAYDLGEFIVQPREGGIEIGDDENISELYPNGIARFDEEGTEIANVYIESGVIEFTIPLNAPDFLFYISKNDLNTSGQVRIFDIEENTAINIDAEIIGKKEYTSSNGVKFTNGLKVEFLGKVTPNTYSEGTYYVEGVGSQITLVRDKDLIIPAAYASEKAVLFDSEGFDRLPFANQSSYAGTKDYIIINRASPDKNPWARYNRWFHKDVIDYAASRNNQPSNIDQSARAKRPIIEFEPGLKLHNSGVFAKKDIDLIDNYTTDVFSIIEGSLGYSVDGVALAEGMRVLFAADTDILVSGKIYEVKFVTTNNRRQITLIETADTIPQDLQTVLITQGVEFAGSLFYYDNSQWKASQTKAGVNTNPTFDLFDANEVSYSDTTTYEASNFTGTKLFSYSQGEGTADSELGFPLEYQSIENSGDILFNFNLLTDTFVYQDAAGFYTVKTDTSFLKKYNNNKEYSYQNGWESKPTKMVQKIIRQYVSTIDQQNNFEVDVVDNAVNVTDLRVAVYVNKQLKSNLLDYELDRINGRVFVRFLTDLLENDVVELRVKTTADKNENGHYDFPINLERNPSNDDIAQFTLGEVIDHVDSMVEDINAFSGIYPGPSNLRDIKNINRYGKRFVKHTAPMNLAGYHITNKNFNIVKSLKQSKNDYAKFKRVFLQTAETLGYDGPTRTHVDLILKELNKDKTPNMPYYFSDMVPTGANNVIRNSVLDSRNPYYQLTSAFDASALSSKSVQVYLNGLLLANGIDYSFSTEGFVLIVAEQNVGDEIEIVEWESTDGSFIPATPTKLGLYPKYEPAIFVDNTYQEETKVIQGHDGSIVVAFNDYRDNLLLELEKRIFNNIKFEYNQEIFNIHDYIPGYYRNTGIKYDDFNNSLLSSFVEWQQLVDADYTDNSFYDRGNQLTFNYSYMNAPNGEELPGFWRGVYRKAYDTDRPHTHPWEMLGITVKPTWWEDTYGKAPYTGDNLILWEDISEGLIKDPANTRRDVRYARPNLLKHIPVDSAGNIASPLKANFAKNYVSRNTRNKFKFGDVSPVENAWRRSSEYPFAIISGLVLNKPNEMFGRCFDLSRITPNLAGQHVYSTTGKFITLADIQFPNSYNGTERVITSGLINYLYNYISANVSSIYQEYKDELTTLTNQLGFKIGGFTDKSKFKLVLDSRTPYNQGNVFVPEENYQIIFNTSSPLENQIYSGVTVEKQSSGFIIRGYAFDTPYFSYHPHIESTVDRTITVGGISETFESWTPNRRFSEGAVIENAGRYYRATTAFESTTVFTTDNLVSMPEVPVEGGKRAIIRKTFSKKIKRLNYGTQFRTSQEVVDFLLGYGKYLEDQGFVFDTFNANTDDIDDWTYTCKEFLFWTTQNWAAGTAISLSPAANVLQFKKDYAVIDNIFDNFYPYSILDADARQIKKEFDHTIRQQNSFGMILKNTDQGIYQAQLPLVQKEHVCLLDNTTQFGDTIFHPATGYRQERIKVIGYRSDEWTGGMDVPGFIYDDTNITVWDSYKDYIIGDVVKYKEFYYVALLNTPGSQFFQTSSWQKLAEKPESQLMVNFDYKINQFADFYDLDSDNFDIEQQKLAQHLIGYQPRNYLANIINDDVSQYKFYQGMIQDKGTVNALSKLFDALNYAEKDSLEFFEEWAVQLGQYGATSKYKDVDFILDESKFRITPQPIELVDIKNPTRSDTAIEIQPYEVYSRDSEYQSKVFPKIDDVKEYIQSAGYVRTEDIKFRVRTKDDLLKIQTPQITVGDYVWVTDDNISFDKDWNVYQLVDTPYNVNSITPEDEGADEIAGSITPFIRVNTTKFVGGDIKKGDVVGIYGAASSNLLNFLYVSEVSVDTMVLQVPEGVVVSAIENVNYLVARFRSVRVKDINELNTLIESYKDENQKVWIDKLDKSWSVIQNTENYVEQQVIFNPATPTDNFQKYGVALSVSDDNRNLMVSASDDNDGKVHYYRRSVETNNLVLTQTILPPDNIRVNDAVLTLSQSVNVVAGHKFKQGNCTATISQTTSGNTVYLENVRGQLNVEGADLISVNGTIETLLGNNGIFDSFVVTQRDINFGSDIAISPDGNFLAVGTPDAAEIRTRFQGDFVPTQEYSKNDVISFREGLYKANRTIIPQQPSVEFNTFNSYTDIAGQDDADSSLISLLLTGNPGLTDKPTDHFLIRAPKTAYLATEPGDSVGLTWNRFSRSNPTLDLTLPWDGDSGTLTYEDITDTHTIVQKVDLVIYVDTFTILPQIGNSVTTPTGSGEVYYIETQDDSVVMYLINVNGVFDAFGDLYVNDADIMGTYNILADNVIDGLSGFWLVNVYSDAEKTVSKVYENGSTWIETGTGLIYNDVKRQSDNRNIFEYFNLQNLISSIGSYTGQQQQAGQIINLTYLGDNGNLATPATFATDKFVVRMSKQYQNKITDINGNVLVDPNTGNNVKVRLQLYDLDNYIIDVASAGFTFEQLNKKHTITDIWDGFIDFEFTEFQNDLPYEPLVGSIITDVQTPFDGFGGLSLSTRTTSRAEVVLYQRDFNKVRVYLKNISGDWSQLNNIGRYEIRREPDATLFPGQPGRVMGKIDSVLQDVAMGTDQIGGLMVFENAEGNLPLVSLPPAAEDPSWQYSKIVDEEYWFYDAVAQQGAQVPANYPDAFNRDYTQVYSIPVDEFGQVQNVNEGTISIFKFNGTSGFRYVDSFVSERASDNRGYGTKLKLVQSGLDYTLLVSSTLGTGQLEIIKHGVPIDKADNYFGEWGPLNTFEQGVIVEYQGEFYEAKRDVPQLEPVIDIGNTTYWNRISWRYGKDDDYRGLFQNDPVLDYAPGELVKYADPDDDSTLKLYKAKTKVDGTQPFSTNDWEIVTSGEDYLGYLPTETNNTLYESQMLFESKWPLTQFAKSFDLSKDGKLLVVLNEHSVEAKVESIDTDADTITIDSTAWLYIGMPVRVRIPNELDSSNAAAQSPLAENQTYYVHSILSDTTFRISSTLFNDETVRDATLAADTADSTWEYLALDEYAEGIYITNFTVDDTIATIGIYKLDGSKYMFKQLLEDTLTKDGIYHDIAVSDDGKFFAVSEPYNDSINIDQGRVLVYKENAAGVFELSQTLISPNNEQSELFGFNIDFSKNEIVITSKNGDITSPTTFDGTIVGNTEPTTTYDSGFTTFNNVLVNSGVVYVFENLNDSFVFAERFNYTGETQAFGEVLVINDNHTYVGMPRIEKDTYQGEIIDYRKPFDKSAWNILRSPVDAVDIKLIEGMFLYNKRTNQKVLDLDYVDIIQGKLPGPAEQEIDYKVPYDPARYNVTPLEGMFDEGDPWGANYVGSVWYDISLSKFVNAYQGDITFQKNNFNKLMPDYLVSVHEWVESDYSPAKWDELSETEIGYQAGITGQTVYSDAQYTQVVNYDSATQTFGSKFYFWVTRKKDVPKNSTNRKLSVLDIGNLIQNPAGNGYKHVALLAQDRFIVHNCDSLLNDKDIVLNVRWLANNDREQNVHTQYQIMSDGLETSKLNPEIEQKWFDSLVGYDAQMRQVPDPNLPVKLKYGNRFSPRQGMFVNKTEALKQVIERVNLVLAEKLIVDDFDLSPLTSSQSIPSKFTNLYDFEIDTVEELRFIGTSKIVQAQLTPVISNGAIRSVEITEPGRGYKDINFNPETDTIRKGPTVEIVGQGTGAEIQTFINNLGQVTSVEVINQGENYTNATRLLVRKLSVLVITDSTVYGKWAIYDWDNSSKEWFRKRVQEFDTSLFWSYADWYANGYNEFTDIDYSLQGTYELYGLENRIGDIVKISSVGTGGWLLLRKVANEDTEDFTINYETIGRQSGTIIFDNSLYDLLNNSLGYDVRSFDSYFYDNQPVQELRIILNTIRDNIFVDELEVEYNNLWFASLRYVFSEQLYVDWAFKTSFVKVKHNLGVLQQDITFNNDTLPSYEAYIEEAKPFKTSIREFVSNYEAIDESNSKISDFDVPAYYDTVSKKITVPIIKVVDDVVVSNDTKINEFPRKDFTDNVGYEITSIEIANPGSKYTFTPKIIIEGGGGSGATAQAYLGRGAITKIEVTNPGSGYISAPTITIQGSQASGGIEASASVIIGNSLIRTALMKVKFDRTSGSMYIMDLDTTETFTGTGFKTLYNLEWPIANDSTKVKISVDGEEALRSEYTYYNKENNDKSYTRLQGVIDFTTPPSNLAVITVEYEKSVDMLHAQDRVNFFYNPTSGMLGKELNQLMDGIDYGGVQIRSFEFTGPSGWDSDSWYSTTWDSYINTFEDEVFIFDGSTISIKLGQPLEAATNYNVYVRLLGETEYTRIDGASPDSSDTTYDGPWIETLIGDGTTDIIELDELGITVKDGDSIIIRKETSDGSFEPDDLSFDTALSGGDLAYSTAKGIAAEEIIIDGDGFVTPTTSKGTEELVPGQLIDSLDIQVYERETGGQGMIYAQTFVLGANDTEFDLKIIPASVDSILVKLDNTLLSPSEYTIDWTNNKLVLDSANLAVNQVLSVVAVGTGQQNVLDTGRFVATGDTADYLTAVKYQESMSAYVTINGIKQDIILIEADDSFPNFGGNTVIRFESEPDTGALIDYVIFADDTIINVSQMARSSLIGDGSTVSFTLPSTPLYQTPLEYKMLVKVGNKVLNPGYNAEFTIPQDRQRQYQLELFQKPSGSISNVENNVKPFINGKAITFPNQWVFDSSNSIIELQPGVGKPGDILEVYIVGDGEYTITNNVITFADTPGYDVGIELITFTNHDILNSERINYEVAARSLLTAGSKEYSTYHRLSTGEILLRKPVIDAQYVWISVNGELLIPSLDYHVTDDRTKVRIEQKLNPDDVIDVLSFSAPIATERFAYRQFKDMLNRTHFKRIDQATTTLTQNLNYYDLRIEVADGSALPEPNKGKNIPGIIWINKERIEYLVKEDNTLRQLRRGTLGTSVNESITSGTSVYDQGPNKSIPYKDETITRIHTTDGSTKVIDLDFDPDNSVQVYNAAHDLEVSAVEFFEVFYQGRRLRKTSQLSFNPTTALDSNEGDIILPPEFSVVGNILTLNIADPDTGIYGNYIPPANVQVHIIRKQGKVWNDPDTSLANSDNNIANFLRSGSINFIE